MTVQTIGKQIAEPHKENITQECMGNRGLTEKARNDFIGFLLSSIVENIKIL